MHTHTQFFLDNRAASRTEFACVARVNEAHNSTSVRSFVECELHKLIPRRIRDGLSETVISDHARDVQLLKGDTAEQRNESVAQLMSEVAAAVNDAFVDAPHDFALLTPLRPCQSLLIRAKESRVVNLLSRRERGEVREAHIYPDRPLVGWKWLRLNFHREAREPLTRRGARDGQRLNLALQRAVQLDSDLADFRERQLVAFERKAGLCVGERVIATARPEAREARLFTRFHAPKESLKRLAQTAQNVLQHLRVNAIQLRSDGFDFGKLVLLVKMANVLSLQLIGIASFLQGCVVEFCAPAKRVLEARDLRFRGEQAVLVSFQHLSRVCTTLK